MALSPVAAAVGWTRYLWEAWFLRAAARWLPRRAGWALARLFGFLDESFTALGAATRAELATTHGLSGSELRRAARTRCSVPYVDMFHMYRLARRKSEQPGWSGTHVAIPEALEARISAGHPTMIVGGHFQLAPYFAMAARVHRLQRELDPTAPLVIVVAQPAAPARNPYVLRDGLRARAFDAALRRIDDGGGHVRMVYVAPDSTASTARELMRVLSQPFSACLIVGDRSWEKAGSLRRPFAGWLDYPLSTGPARMAARTGATVTVAIPQDLGRGRHVIQWSRPLDAREFGTPVALTNYVADRLEEGVGQRPAEYALNLGFGRVWVGQQWRPAEPAESS